MSGSSTPEVPEVPALRVSAGATPEEVAALVLVLAAAGGEPPAPARPVSTWAAHTTAVRAPVAHGPGAWQTTYRH
ncbi:acyl-CoA carboxylase subunit epsilon [Phycicoccus endophyticus]|uniref:Acyl-CoA carboxylase subunit epsilon n=1 Tax=Phycicoccus endophyticus TaxID=1690220 RepID=A0A7G9R302_9MICO|nr:acyl-CoA carboxylase epsilon subunit [Phycicoccus endophyticus]NHI20270.1 acyl-CoA carboxylase subunit epsilon [Phycicoccus endophyticus]QNN49977.1 acyl-CoA carboxylase subunit epsilon [Phycicoccus endophyticus]GGL29123.1 hypothetical protein GCM10012283_09270 [Phycicoccus endophyticus]